MDLFYRDNKLALFVQAIVAGFIVFGVSGMVIMFMIWIEKNEPKTVTEKMDLNAPLVITDPNGKPKEEDISYFFVDLRDRKTKKVFKVRIILMPDGAVRWKHEGFVEDLENKNKTKDKK